MIGSYEMLIVDCPDPKAMARFYAELVGAQIVGWDDGWTEIARDGDTHPLMAFQRVQGEYSAPEWPGQEKPQQMHIDVRVDDFDAAEAAVLALGATDTGVKETGFRVYLDPAGHPFCLIRPTD